MSSHVISDERSKEINDPNYLHKCSKCGEIKPNTEFSKSANQGRGKGRGYTSQCKSCRSLYAKTYDPIKKLETRRVQFKKHKLNIAFNSSRANANKRGLEHSITMEYLENLYNTQKRSCYYTNKPALRDTRGIEGNNNSVSIDRIDSKKGYVEGNVVLCRWIVNRMKNDINFSDFLELVSEINKNFNLQ